MRYCQSTIRTPKLPMLHRNKDIIFPLRFKEKSSAKCFGIRQFSVLLSSVRRRRLVLRLFTRYGFGRLSISARAHQKRIVRRSSHTSKRRRLRKPATCSSEQSTGATDTTGGNSVNARLEWRIRWDLNPGLSAFCSHWLRRPTRFMAQLVSMLRYGSFSGH